MNAIKQYYTSIYAMAYSANRNYLVAGNCYGDIAVFNLIPIFEAGDTKHLNENLKLPYFKFEAHSSAVFSLISTKKLIISGSIDEISAWLWSDIKKKESKRAWCLNLGRISNLMNNEVNSLALSFVNDSMFYAGCGDNKVYCIDVETGTVKFSLSGHTDYVHCVTAIGAQECASASEDGSVRLWDARTDGREVNIIEPYKNKELDRPEFGKWLGCVSVDESKEWLVCGGGPILCTWHLGALLPATKFVKHNTATHVVKFCEDSIISGGSTPCMNHWSRDGKLVAEIPTSASCVFDINISSTANRKILCAAGSSYKIDICNDFRFKEYSLIFAL